MHTKCTKVLPSAHQLTALNLSCLSSQSIAEIAISAQEGNSLTQGNLCRACHVQLKGLLPVLVSYGFFTLLVSLQH